MDRHQQQQTQQMEKLVMKMLDFLESSSEDESELDQLPMKEKHEKIDTIKIDIKYNIITKNITNQTTETEKLIRVDEKEMQELHKLDNQQHEENAAEVVSNNNNSEIESNNSASAVLANLDEQYKLENHCRYSYNNSFAQEVFKALYQDTTSHPAVGSADYYKAAQNYVLYGKDFLDFPDNIQLLLNDRNSQNSVCEGTNFIANFGNSTYFTPNATATLMSGGLATTAAAYYYMCNSLQAQAQARPSLATSAANLNQSFGLFLGNKLTYVGGTLPTATSLMYNQQNTTTNFISNSLANAVLATTPTILYTSPMLANTQQYLTQYLSATANSMQSSAVAANAYERLSYAQILQQQLYHTPRPATVAPIFQHKQRVAARNSNKIMTNRPNPLNLTAIPQTTINNTGSNLNTTRSQQVGNSSLSIDSVGIKSQLPTNIATETSKNQPVSGKYKELNNFFNF